MSSHLGPRYPWCTVKQLDDDGGLRLDGLVELAEDVQCCHLFLLQRKSEKISIVGLMLLAA